MSATLLDRIKWLGHDGFEITVDDKKLMIDPFQVKGQRSADVILVTHVHHDHCSVDDIAKLVKPTSVIVTEPESAKKLTDLCKDMLRRVEMNAIEQHVGREKDGALPRRHAGLDDSHIVADAKRHRVKCRLPLAKPSNKS